MKSWILPSLFTLLCHAPVFAQAAGTATGSAEAGKALWAAEHCSFCHGGDGEGGFGPDLAGRALTPAQFIRAVRQPWGVMPQFGESQLSDQELLDIRAYLGSLPAPATLGKWHWPLPPAGAPLGQVLQISVGCGQCHEPELGMPRRQLGANAKDASFEAFADVIYNHNAKYPKGNMGNFSRERVSEPVLREIYDFMFDLGLRVPISGTITPNAAGGAGAYTLTVANTGTPGKGLDAEIVTVSVVVPEGYTVAKADGPGYKGVRRAPAQRFAFDGTGRLWEWEADALVWEVPRVNAGSQQVFSFSLAGATAGGAVLDSEAFDGSIIRWEKPTTPPGRRHPEFRDHRIPEVGDANVIRFRQP